MRPGGACRPASRFIPAGPALNGERRWLRQRQGVALQRTTDACGRVFPSSLKYTAQPRPRELAGDPGAIDGHAASALRASLQPGEHAIGDGRLHCRRGLALADLHEGAGRGLPPTGNVRLPAWNASRGTGATAPDGQGAGPEAHRRGGLGCSG